MGTVKIFEEFEVWGAGREITQKVYTLTRQKTFAQDFALRDQIRRASISIMSNIAEGFESQTKKTFVRHLGIAKGSAGEVRSQLYVALDQNYITKSEFESLMELVKKTSRQLSTLVRFLSPP